jgi:hypothetical protein
MVKDPIKLKISAKYDQAKAYNDVVCLFFYYVDVIGMEECLGMGLGRREI